MTLKAAITYFTNDRIRSIELRMKTTKAVWNALVLDSGRLSKVGWHNSRRPTRCRKRMGWPTIWPHNTSSMLEIARPAAYGNGLPLQMKPMRRPHPHRTPWFLYMPVSTDQESRHSSIVIGVYRTDAAKDPTCIATAVDCLRASGI